VILQQRTRPTREGDTIVSFKELVASVGSFGKEKHGRESTRRNSGAPGDRRGSRRGSEPQPATGDLRGSTGSTAAEEGFGARDGIHWIGVSSGELIIWPFIISQIGLVFSWVAVIGVLS